ncbi:MAG: hypothetical protein HYV94_04555, partial [Candidatus Rokubacteria bacterium]|nr:hypothetical protein [Candidatus Rokubacteria bacterium]
MNGLYLRRWMLFVDGENLTIQAQRLASAGRQGIAPDARHYRQDTFLWTPKLRPMRPLGADTWSLQPAGLRAYYYTSVVGNDETLQDVVRARRTLGFHPEVFQKPKGMKSKGVDVSL